MWSKKHCCGTAINKSFASRVRSVWFIPLQRTRCHGRSVSYTELGRSLVLLVKVLLRKRHKLCAIFLLYGCALSVELLDFVKPGNAMAEPYVCRFEAILIRCLLAMRIPGGLWTAAFNAGAKH